MLKNWSAQPTAPSFINRHWSGLKTVFRFLPANQRAAYRFRASCPGLKQLLPLLLSIVLFITPAVRLRYHQIVILRSIWMDTSTPIIEIIALSQLLFAVLRSSLLRLTLSCWKSLPPSQQHGQNFSPTPQLNAWDISDFFYHLNQSINPSCNCFATNYNGPGAQESSRDIFDLWSNQKPRIKIRNLRN